jgi:uncharacterized delta-60 repeat protein
LDTAFNPGANGVVYTLAVQPDDKILVGGDFTTLSGQTRNYIGRLNSDGSLDTAFNPGADDWVVALAVQVDGKILVAGGFNALGGGARSYIGRLGSNGGLDATFNPGADSWISALALQSDGKVVVGGNFTTLDGRSRSYIGRLSSPAAALQTLSVSPGGTTITWMRNGAGPEVALVSFEAWIEGGSGFVFLGLGTRIDGGWQLAGQQLPPQENIWIVARGYYSTGMYAGSTSQVQLMQHVYPEHAVYLPLILRNANLP